MKRGEIFQAVVERLETILPQNGYQTDLGQRIKTWHPRNVPIEPGFYGVIVMDEREELEKPDGSTYLHKLTISFTIVNAATVAGSMIGFCRQALDDLVSAFESSRLTLGGSPVDYLDMEFNDGGTIEFNQLETLAATLEISATVTYRTPRNQW